jgi:hypothetical protein
MNPIEKLKYIVTGTGRCGTVFMARLLTSLDYPCGHEAIFNPEMIPTNTSHCSLNERKGKNDWIPLQNWLSGKETIAESSYMSAPYLDSPLVRKVKLIEVVRHPLKVMASFNQEYFLEKCPANKWEANMDKSVPGVFYLPDQISRVSDFYVRWMRMIESRARKDRYIHRIEDQVTPELLNFLERDGSENYFKEVVNSWNFVGRKELALSDIPKEWREEIVYCGEKNGYSF